MIDRLSDASSQMTFTEVARGKAVTKSELNSDDGVYLPHPSVLQFAGNLKISTVFVDWNDKKWEYSPSEPQQNSGEVERVHNLNLFSTI